MKKGTKKGKSPKRPKTDQTIDGQNIAPSNETQTVQTSYVQAKPVSESEVPNLSGTWKTCGQSVVLTKMSTGDGFEGDWGIHRIRFIIEGTEIIRAKLGSMDLMFGGSILGSDGISWGNGQSWTRM